LSTIRKQARTLLAATKEVREREEKKLLDSLRRRGLASDAATLDDILNLTVEDTLNRRLQTVVFKRGMATSPLSARQLVVHGHIAVGARRIRVPGYLVGRTEEGSVAIYGGKQVEAPQPAPSAS